MRTSIANLIALLLVMACSAGTDPAEQGAGAAGAEIAAGVPDTEIYLAELAWHPHGPVMGEPRNITQRAGYDNQPKFMPDGRSLVFSSIRDGVQSDIYHYLIDEDQAVAYALTAESEYSPTPMPDGSGISVVRVEADGTQRLWRFPAANAQPGVLFPDARGVGYHAWLPGGQVAMFIVPEHATRPPTLLLAGPGAGESRTIAEAIGRGLAQIPGEAALAFIDQQDNGTWRLARYDLATGALAEFIDTPPGSEDFAWTAAGGVFMGDGMVLRYWDGQADTTWQGVADLTGKLSGRITRLDVSPDASLLAFVVAPASTP